ncbi:MAG TPA: hypothetical protein VG245_04950 [Candidatus Dormibacteraeota bacterium]|jgi:hypothetical protein|nr:hypothetical protein [Candidatus Dormibacteraeota bacterium]
MSNARKSSRARRAVIVAVATGLVAAAQLVSGLGAPAPAPGGAVAAAPALARAAAVYAAVPAVTPAPSPAAIAKLQAGARKPHPHDWRVGFAKESVDPTAAMIAAGFHLGGFGLGPTRQTTGPLVLGDGSVDHIYARATAISNQAGATLLLAALENQGTFAADKQGPYGLYDMRVQVSQDTGVPVDMIVINSDHSHAGPDLIGLWGGVPVEYLQEVFAQTVKALDEAYQRRVPGDLVVGVNRPVVPDHTMAKYRVGTATPGEDFVHSQFGVDTGQNNIPGTGYDDGAVDTQLRVLQAVGDDGRPLGTLINYAAHATVMDGGNLGYSADWPGRVARATEISLKEPVAVTMVADVGRSQPPRPNTFANCDQPGQPTCNADKLETWTRLFTPWVVAAVADAVPVRGTTVAGTEVLTREAATNPALLGVSYSGEGPVQGTGAYRSVTTPWVAGNLIGTFASAHRLGDILLTANPGEAYPDIRFGVGREIKAPQAFFTFGLANDQLGYLIAPASEYPWITYSNVGNDNSFFNVSVQYGDHLYCTETAETVALGFTPTNDPQPYGPNATQPQCAALTASDAVPPGPAPQQPWLLGSGVAVAAPAVP